MFKNLIVDELGSDAPLPVSEQEPLQAPDADPIELTFESPSQPIVDPPDFTLETQDTVSPNHLASQENAQAESRQNDPVRHIVDDGLSYFSFTGSEQTQEDSTSNDTLEKEHAEESEQTIQSMAPAPFRATIKRHTIDKRQVVMVSLIGLLSVVFVLALLWAFAPSLFEAKKQNQLNPLDSTPLHTVLVPSPEQVWPKPPRYPQTLRDPMRSVVAKKIETHDIETQQKVNLNIVGIVFSEDKPSVIIGQKILFVGDVVDDAKIISISKTKVVFESNHQQWSQRL